jgi:hypothetical protein
MGIPFHSILATALEYLPRSSAASRLTSLSIASSKSKVASTSVHGADDGAGLDAGFDVVKLLLFVATVGFVDGACMESALLSAWRMARRSRCGRRDYQSRTILDAEKLLLDR